MRLLERWCPYRRLRNGLLVLAATGVWLRVEPRFGSAAWGLTEWVHVVLGLAGLAVYVGYQSHHLAAKWGELHRAALVSGVALAVAMAGVMISGLVLLGPLTGERSQLVRDVHLGATIAVGVGLAWHLLSRAGGWRARLPARAS